MTFRIPGSAVVLVAFAACAGSTGPAPAVRGLLVHLDRVPTTADSVAVIWAADGHPVYLTALTRTMGLKTSAPVAVFAGISHVLRVDDMRMAGYDELEVSVRTATSATSADSLALVALAEPIPAAKVAYRLGDSTLSVYTTLEQLPGVDQYLRFVAASAEASGPAVPAGAGRHHAPGVAGGRPSR